MNRKNYRLLFIALMALMQTSMAQAQVNNEVRKVPPGAPQNVMVRECSNNDKNQAHFFHKKNNQMKRSDEDVPTHQLTINLEYDNTKYVLYRIDIQNEENSYMGYSAQDPFSVAEGSYDICAFFYSKNSIWLPVNYYVVIKEGINVNEDISVTINPDEATNKIDFDMYLPDGETIKVPHCDYTQVDDNGNWLILDPGNIKDMFITFEITKPHVGFGLVDATTFTIDSQDNFNTLYVNNFSDDYSITCFIECVDFDLNMYTTTFETKGSSPKTIRNDPAEFIVYEQRLNQSEYGKTQLDDVYISNEISFELLNGYGNRRVIHNKQESANNQIKVFCGQQPNNPDFDFVVRINVGRVETRKIDEMPWGEKVFSYTHLYSLPIYQRLGKNQRLNYGRTAWIINGIPGFNTYLDEADKEYGVGFYDMDRWEENPALSYLPDRIKGIQGDNVPILVPLKNSYRVQEGENYGYVTIIDPVYLGRYGEYSENDVKATHTIMKVNNEVLIDSEEATYGWSEDGDLMGVVDITLTNQNRKIDELQGQNLTTIHYDRDQEDSTAPVLQMLHFKDGEGYITDRFETSEGALVELFAGDFNDGISEQNWLYFDRAKAKTVDVAYAPYGKDNWTELTLEENPEYYSNLVGWYYAASLADVTGTAEKGWFDLKIRLEDEAGNWQEQVISPAFRINDLVDTGIENMEHSTWNIEHAEAVYDVMGRHVGNNLSTRQLANSSTSNKGIRIVRKANGDVRKVVAK